MRGRMIVGVVMLGAMAAAPIGGAHSLLPTEHGYVTNQVIVPSSNQEARQFSRDIDRDGDKDNALASWFVALAQASGSVDLGAPWSDAIVAGDIVMLHSLRANSLANTRNATWQVWYGAPTENPDLTGGGTFDLLTNQPHSTRIAATIKSHIVRSVAGRIPVRLDLGAGPFVLPMTRAKVVATCFQNSCSNGRINGAISQQDIEVKFIPELADAAQAAVVEDCPGGSCASGSMGEAMVSLFDTDDEGVDISLAEVQNNTLVETILRPDLNLVSGDGGADDHISFGFGFTTVKAKLTRP